MNCPYCEKEIEFVLCVSYYYQNQLLDENGILLHEWEDAHDPIGDTIKTQCPECFFELDFDSNGKLIKPKNEE